MDPKAPHAPKDFLALYEYVGGGYFRPKGIKKGQGVKAECVHGMEAIELAVQMAYHAGFQDGFSVCEKGYSGNR